MLLTIPLKSNPPAIRYVYDRVSPATHKIHCLSCALAIHDVARNYRVSRDFLLRNWLRLVGTHPYKYWKSFKYAWLEIDTFLFGIDPGNSCK